MTNHVNNPKHYNQHSIECIEFTRYMDFNLGNAFKYIWRCYDKGKPVEDLKKAIWYLRFVLENIDDSDFTRITEHQKELSSDFVISNSKFKNANQKHCLFNILHTYCIDKESTFTLINHTIQSLNQEIKTIEAKND